MVSITLYCRDFDFPQHIFKNQITQTNIQMIIMPLYVHDVPAMTTIFFIIVQLSKYET